MNREDYISKYLDGELDTEDDSIFRSLLAEDESYKDKFDASIDLIHAIKQDSASISVPESFSRHVEDLVMMSILQTEQKTFRIYPKKTYFPAMAAAIAFFFISFVFNINDLNFPDFSITNYSKQGNEKNLISSSSSDKVQSSEIPNSSAKAVKQNINNRLIEVEITNSDVSNLKENDQALPLSEDNDNKVENSKILQVTDKVESSDQKIDQKLNSTIGTQSNDINSSKILENVNRLPSGSNENKQENIYNSQLLPFNPNLINSNSQLNTRLFNPVNSYEIYPTKVNVHLSSFVGSDVYRGAMKLTKTTPINNYSQSLAYSINSRIRTGLEIGVATYYFEDVKYIVIPIRSTSLTRQAKPDNMINSIENPVTTIRVPLRSQIVNQMFWGAAFFEYSLYNSSSSDLFSRIGFGTNENGVIGYLRILGKYEILPWIGITAGADMKLFQSNIPNNSANSDIYLNKTISIIYGFQLKL
ncbi:MAG: hypothetical protein NT007_12810 [Candidatus Kapabacteria bacterium]|nr:hypothetical protein [Candidatus Kapabacteria bacterium]